MTSADGITVLPKDLSGSESGEREKWGDGPTLFGQSSCWGPPPWALADAVPLTPGSLAPLSTHASVQTLCPLPPAERLSRNLLPADTLTPTRPFQPHHPLLSCFPGSHEEPTTVPGLPSAYAVPSAWDTLPLLQHQAAVPLSLGLVFTRCLLGGSTTQSLRGLPARERLLGYPEHMGRGSGQAPDQLCTSGHPRTSRSPSVSPTTLLGASWQG